jgi:hypothetical protein
MLSLKSLRRGAFSIPTQYIGILPEKPSKTTGR